MLTQCVHLIYRVYLCFIHTHACTLRTQIVCYPNLNIKRVTFNINHVSGAYIRTCQKYNDNKLPFKQFLLLLFLYLLRGYITRNGE